MNPNEPIIMRRFSDKEFLMLLIGAILSTDKSDPRFVEVRRQIYTFLNPPMLVSEGWSDVPGATNIVKK